MPVIQNTLSHGVKPTDQPRLGPGEVREVDDKSAKAYLSIDGVERSDSDALSAQSVASGGPSASKTGDQVLAEDLAGSIADLGLHIAAPNQVVIGDDEAPLGPATGVRSTKRQEAEKDLAHRLAFADNEALHKVDLGDAPATTPHGVDNSQVIHNRQFEAQQRADEAAQALNEVYEDPEGDVDDADEIEESEEAPPVEEPQA